jgi:hypothetical protein
MAFLCFLRRNCKRTGKRNLKSCGKTSRRLKAKTNPIQKEKLLETNFACLIVPSYLAQAVAFL